MSCTRRHALAAWLQLKAEGLIERYRQDAKREVEAK